MGAHQEGGRVAGAHVVDLPGFRMHRGVEEGDEHLVRDVGEEGVVEVADDLYRVGVLKGEGAQHVLSHRRVHRRVHPLAGDIGHQQTDAPVGQADQVVEVTADLGFLQGRVVARGQA